MWRTSPADGLLAPTLQPLLSRLIRAHCTLARHLWPLLPNVMAMIFSLLFVMLVQPSPSFHMGDLWMV
jgi:hypothetical protein